MKSSLSPTLHKLQYFFSGEVDSLLHMKYSNEDGDSYNISVDGFWSHSSGEAGIGKDALLYHYITNPKVITAVDSNISADVITYEVFPDYCSTGLWDKESGRMAEIPDWLPEVVKIAIKYWHLTWELFVSCGYMPDDAPRCSKEFFDDWQRDGVELTAVMNSFAGQIQDVNVVFVYAPQPWEGEPPLTLSHTTV